MKSWLPLVTPVILVLVAGCQIYRANFRDLTPWKGGGFGMFASVDSRSARILRAYVQCEGEQVAVSIPDDLADRASKFRAQPDQQTLQRLAEEMKLLVWYDRDEQRSITKQARLLDQGIDPASIKTAAFQRQPEERRRLAAVDRSDVTPAKESVVIIDSIRLELWRRKFDTQSATVTRELSLEAEATNP